MLFHVPARERREIRQDVTSHSTLIFHNFGRVRVVWGLLEFGFGVRVGFRVDFDLVGFGFASILIWLLGLISGLILI